MAAWSLTDLKIADAGPIMSAEEHPTHASVLEQFPEQLRWAGCPEGSDLAVLPGTPAVYLLLAAADVPVQLGTTQHLRRVVVSRLADPQRPQRGQADLAGIVRGLRWRGVHSAFEARWWYYRLARQMYPKRYRQLISFGPAWFLHVDWQQGVPELRVTERIWELPGELLGPWLTHDTCQRALEGLWDLFDLCRYPEQVRRAPGGQRCAYADMGRCDAPCEGAVPLGRYVERCRSAWAFAGGAVDAWVADADRRMNEAARIQRFEEAGKIKQQLSFAEKWRQQWFPVIRPAAEMNDLLAVPVTRRRAWKLFLFRQGCLRDGPVVAERKLPPATCAWLRQELARVPEPLDARARMEQTWLVAHFRSSREGDASLIRPLRAGALPPELEDDLRELLAQRRAARAAQADVAARRSSRGGVERLSEGGAGGKTGDQGELI